MTIFFFNFEIILYFILLKLTLNACYFSRDDIYIVNIGFFVISFYQASNFSKNKLFSQICSLKQQKPIICGAQPQKCLKLVFYYVFTLITVSYLKKKSPLKNLTTLTFTAYPYWMCDWTILWNILWIVGIILWQF